MAIREKFPAACYLFLEENEKILLSKRANSGYFDGYYSFVAGHLEKDEGCFECMIREAKEESNIDIKKEDLEVIFVVGPSPVKEYFCIFFKIKKYENVIKNMEPQKCEEIKFFDLNNLPENIVPEVKCFLENKKLGKIFAERDY